MRLTISCSRWLPADRCQLPVQSRVDQRVGTTPGKHGMTLTLETIISETHAKQQSLANSDNSLGAKSQTFSIIFGKITSNVDVLTP